MNILHCILSRKLFSDFLMDVDIANNLTANNLKKKVPLLTNNDMLK